MTTTTKLKQIASNWRLHGQNYIGSLAYYLMFLSVVLIAIKYYLQLSQYIIYWQSTSQTESAVPVSSVAYQPILLEVILMYVLSVSMALLTMAIVLLLPYVFGYLSNKTLRAVMGMASLKLNHKNLFKLKYSYVVLVMAVVILTIYDYNLSTQANWYAFMLLGFNAIALLLFWLQSLLVKLWKFKATQIY